MKVSINDALLARLPGLPQQCLYLRPLSQGQGELRGVFIALPVRLEVDVAVEGEVARPPPAQIPSASSGQAPVCGTSAPGSSVTGPVQ